MPDLVSLLIPLFLALVVVVCLVRRVAVFDVFTQGQRRGCNRASLFCRCLRGL